MDRLIDEIVKVSVSDARAAATPTSVNTVALLGVTTKAGAKTQVLYDHDSVIEAYDTGSARVVELAISVTTAASGTVKIKLGDDDVASLATTSSSTVATVCSGLASAFNNGDTTASARYKASSTATKVVLTAKGKGTEYNEDGTFSVVSGGGFSGTATNTAGVNSPDMVTASKSFFLEPATPGKLVCIPTESAPTKTTIANLLETAAGLGKDDNGRDVDFYHVIIRMPESAVAADIIDMVEGDANNKGLEEWCEENFRIAHVEIQSRSVAEAVLTGLSKPTNRVAFYFHKETSGKCFAAALAAERCGKDPARGTWAHKTLASIVSDATSKANLKDAQAKGLNVYVKIAGVERSYFGTLGSNTMFIDSQIKKDWLKFRNQEAIFDVLGSANNGDGVDFNDDGIPGVIAKMTEVFATAEDNDHRYVLPDSWEITATLYKDIPAADKAVRNLPKVKATFQIQESIHTVKTVELQVVA